MKLDGTFGQIIIGIIFMTVLMAGVLMFMNFLGSLYVRQTTSSKSVIPTIEHLKSKPLEEGIRCPRYFVIYDGRVWYVE